jgi:acetyl esterase/lipase
MPTHHLTFSLHLLLLLAPSLPATETVRIQTDVPYLEPNRSEKLDLYLPAPKPTDAPLSPALVWIHGGGWSKGTKSEARAVEICTTLAEAGYVAVSIDYRLGDAAWPQNLLDCKNAVRFLRSKAGEFGLDPDRLAVAGGSAGGHLALMVAYTTGQPDLEPAQPYPDQSSAVRCVINMYGITNILTRVKTDAQGHPTSEPNPGSALRVFDITTVTDPLLKLGSPVNHITPASPPTLILHGRADATVDYLQAEELARVLQQNQVPHQLHLIDGIGHTFAFQTWGKRKLPQDLRPLVFAFLNQHLR